MNFPFNSTNCWRIFITLGLLAVLSACSRSEVPLVEINGSTMGTSYLIKVVETDLQAEVLQARVDKRLIALNQILSTYIPTSELSQLNALETDEPVPVSQEMRAVLKMSRDVFDLSDGAFDVTVGPLVNLWGFGPDGPANGVPPADEIHNALARTGFNLVSVTNDGLSKPPGLYLDLSAVAKGYAVDEISLMLEQSGAARYMVEIGGEVRTRGLNQRGKAWVIGLEAPDRSARRLQRTVPVRDLGLATSGDYRNYFEHGGKVYSHTIDPRTGWPVTHNQASVTVLHPSTGMADALATAFSVLGPEKTMLIAEEKNLPVLAIIRKDGHYKEVQSSAMTLYLERQ